MRSRSVIVKAMTSMFSSITLNCSASSTRTEAACVLIWCNRIIRVIGLWFQKFTFENVGEIDFIVGGALTPPPSQMREVEGRHRADRDHSRDHRQ